jgi:hypothetical protein
MGLLEFLYTKETRIVVPVISLAQSQSQTEVERLVGSCSHVILGASCYAAVLKSATGPIS